MMLRVSDPQTCFGGESVSIQKRGMVDNFHGSAKNPNHGHSQEELLQVSRKRGMSSSIPLRKKIGGTAN